MGKMVIKYKAIQLMLPIESEGTATGLNEISLKVIGFAHFKENKEKESFSIKKKEIVERLSKSAKNIEWLYPSEEIKEG